MAVRGKSTLSGLYSVEVCVLLRSRSSAAGATLSLVLRVLPPRPQTCRESDYVESRRRCAVYPFRDDAPRARPGSGS